MPKPKSNTPDTATIQILAGIGGQPIIAGTPTATFWVSVCIATSVLVLLGRID